MIVACPSCREQYDTSRPVGSQIPCVCGSDFTIEARASHAPRVIRCQSCGGPLEDGSRRCDFCTCEVTLEERLLSEVCPACYARMAKGAHFCMECGVSIAPQKLLEIPEDSRCPRCEGNLRIRVLGKASVIECGLCAGLWLDPQCFENLCTQADLQSRALQALSERRPPIQAITEAQVKYLPCVSCKDMMVRRNFALSGVVIDLCRDHGVWLDHGELDKILQHVRRGGLVREREPAAPRARGWNPPDPPTIPPMFDGATGSSSLGDTDLVDVLAWVGGTLGRLFRR